MIDITNSISIGSAINGISWSSYWATLISATVETAAPTHVVLTFPTAQTSLGATDFTIAGFTVSSASWTGSGLTLVLSVAVTAYNDDLTITFVKTGETATVTNNVAIADTVGWYVSGDGSATYVTKDGSDLVSVWKDLSGANHPLNQATSTKQPLWSANGILFDGVDDLLLTDAFTYNQPRSIYLVIKQVTATNGDVIFDGGIINQYKLRQNETARGIDIYCGTAYKLLITTFTVGHWGILRYILDGASSRATHDDNAPISENPGTANANGFVLGADGSRLSWSNIEVKEVILRNTADSVDVEAAINNYLSVKYAFFLT